MAVQVAAARQQEQEAGAARLQAAVEEERRRHSKTKLSVVVSGDDSPSLASKLAAAQQRADAAEQELARVAAAAGRAAAAPAAEVRRLRAALEASQAEGDMLRSRLAAQERERERSPGRAAPPTGRRGRSGLASELEEGDEARIQGLELQVQALQAELAAAEGERSRLAAQCAQLEQRLQDAQQQQRSTGSSGDGRAASAAAGAAGAAEAEVWERELARLREEKAALQDECRRLRREAAAQAAEVEHLTQRLEQLAGRKGGSSPLHCPQAAPGTVQGSEGSAGAVQAAQHQAAADGIGSPIDEPAGAAPNATRPGNAGSREPQPGSPAAVAMPSSPTRHVAASPGEAAQRHFRGEMRHTLRGAERPGVVSRFPHSLGAFLALRGDLRGELEAELGAELASFGVDPGAAGMSADHYEHAMAELEQRRAGGLRGAGAAGPCKAARLVGCAGAPSRTC